MISLTRVWPDPLPMMLRSVSWPMPRVRKGRVVRIFTDRMNKGTSILYIFYEGNVIERAELVF